MLVLSNFLHFIQYETSAEGWCCPHSGCITLITLSGNRFTDKPGCVSHLFKFTVKISMIKYRVFYGEKALYSAGRPGLGPSPVSLRAVRRHFV